MLQYRLIGIRDGGPNEELDKADALFKVVVSMARYCQEWQELQIEAPNGSVIVVMDHEGIRRYG